MKIGCSTAFHKDSLDGALSRIAHMGFKEIDLICIPGWNHIQPQQLVADFNRVTEDALELLDRHNLRVLALNMAVPDLHQRDDPARNEERRAQTKALVKFMVRLGVKTAGFYPGYYAHGRDWNDVLRDTASSLLEMLEIAGEANVLIGPEIHRFTPFETPDQARALLEAVPGLTVVYDASHFVMQGFDLKDTEFLIPYAHHVHFRSSAKEAMQCPLAHSTVDFFWILESLKAYGYDGNAAIEYISDFPGDVEKEIVELQLKLQHRLGTN